MRLHQLLYTLSFLCLFSCKKENHVSVQSPSAFSKVKSVNDSVEDRKSSTKPAAQPAIKTDSYFTYKKWNIVDKSNETYKFPGFITHLKSYLDEAKNIGGKKVYVNNKEIDFNVTDTYVFTPFIFINGEEKVLLIQEEDESGVYGYSFYYFNKDKFIKKEYLDIAPENTLEIDKFVKIKNEAQNLKITILTDKYYDARLEEMRPSSGYNLVINKTVQDERTK
ncbi:hypothetical protein [Chryseobacterium sp. 22458]|uniref:hypothetical protein n=1 Tax=Chryseobacterium sp. 22458 TaxID=3453921 RepID=UPI003F860683